MYLIKRRKIMADKGKRNTSNPQGKGNPSDTGQDKASVKEGKNTKELKKEEEIRNRHMEEGGEIPSHLQKGRNRNPDKPDIDKPAYGNSK